MPPVLKKQERVESNDLESGVPVASPPPKVPPKDITDFLTDLDYAVPSDIFGASITKAPVAPKKAVPPPELKPQDVKIQVCYRIC